MPENMTHGYMGTKKNHQKTAKNSFLCLKIQPGRRKELIFLINSVLEDILIFNLRLKENFFLFFEKKVSKNYKCYFVGSDPRLLEIGAK